jgi:hypothetical protein
MWGLGPALRKQIFKKTNLTKNTSPSPKANGIESVGRIRIREGKNDPQKEKKIKNFYVLKCWMFAFESFASAPCTKKSAPY